MITAVCRQARSPRHTALRQELDEEQLERGIESVSSSDEEADLMPHCLQGYGQSSSSEEDLPDILWGCPMIWAPRCRPSRGARTQWKPPSGPSSWATSLWPIKLVLSRSNVVSDQTSVRADAYHFGCFGPSRVCQAWLTRDWASSGKLLVCDALPAYASLAEMSGKALSEPDEAPATELPTPYS